MNKLKEALELAQKIPGMASVRIQWNPYEAGWFGQADWSNGKKVATPTFTLPEEAADVLVSQLMTASGR